MISNKLIKTNTLWYKIKNFFNRIFNRNKNNFINEDFSIEKSETQTFINNLSVKEELQNQNRKKLMAQKLINKEINSYDLEYEEIDEMTDYFTEDIKKIDEELLRIKNHIQKIKQELNN